MEHRSGISFPVHCCLWEPLSGLQLGAGYCTTQRAIGHMIQWNWGRWNWAVWWPCSPVSSHLYSHLHATSLWKEEELENSGFFYLFVLFYFLPKVYCQFLSCGSNPQSSVYSYSYSALMD